MPDVAQQLSLYRLLVDKSLGLMCIHDMEGRLLVVNPAVGQSLGYPPGAGIGRNLRDFLAPSVQPLFEDYLRRIRETGVDHGHMRLVAGDGSERVWSYRNILHSEPGEQPKVLGHALDVTERVRVERKLRERERELARAHDEMARRVVERTAEFEEANRRLRAEMAQREVVEEELLQARKLESRGVLAGGIAHDFNNFLTVIQGNISLAMMELPPGGRPVESLQQAESACGRAAGLASQLLTFAKGGAPVRRPGSIAKLIESAAQLAGAGSAAKVALSIPPGLWSAEFDAAQMSQVLQNVLHNARESMPEGGAIHIEAGNVAEAPHPLSGPCVRVTVRDQGCGIPPGDLSKIFDPFFTTKRGGSGLGLAVAYYIVQKHHGHIAVESQVNQGTAVTIHLPATDRPAAGAEPAPRARPRGSRRILVMDDDEQIRRLLCNTLRQLGYSTECAPEGEKAVAKYIAARESAAPFDAVILDLTIPGGMGGRQAAAKLRQIDPGAKLILSSGYSDEAVIAEYRKHGFDDVLLKPWTRTDLAGTLDRVLG
jgi:PAS domain S-box-containing protein